MQTRPRRARRSVLYVPASNERALAKIASLSCDAVIVDLEDAVAPERKDEAREAMRAFFREKPRDSREWIIRINALASQWGTEDFLAARACRPDAILLPKVETARDVLEAADALVETDADPALRLWAMVETPRAVLDIGAIAELGRDAGARLDCLVAGTNDLTKETGVLATPDRRYLTPWLTQIVLAARAGGLDALDGVHSGFSDLGAFGRECAEGRNMGFDGKTLIHPAQIEPANLAFSPSDEEVAEALAIREAFALPQNSARGVVSIGGKMIERLHLHQAERLLAKAGH